MSEHRPVPAEVLAVNDRLLAELQGWRQLARKVIGQEFPLLPEPEWSQDQAYVAFTIDRLMGLPSKPEPPPAPCNCDAASWAGVHAYDCPLATKQDL